MGPVAAAASFIIKAAAANTIKGFLIRTVLTVGAQMAFQALSPKPKMGPDSAASGVEQQRQLGEATPRAIALGWTIVAGSECALWASGDGDDNRFNTRVIVVSDWPTQLQKVWVRGRELTFEGDINTGWFACNQYRSKQGAARVWMRFIRGDWNQAADPLLISYANANGSWTADDRLRGVSALLIRREYDVDAFQSGAPDNDDLRVEVRNAPVYDWRDATQSLTDVTTWKPSENPVVLLENALSLLRAPAQFSPGSTDPIVGPGLDFSRRPLAKLTAMANICDELVSGQPRYRAGGVVTSTMNGRAIIERFAAACAGSWVSSGEGGYLRPGHVPAPVMDIPVGALQASASDRYDPWARPDAAVNTVIASYPDPALGWQITPLPAASDPAWVSAQGGVRSDPLDLSFVPYRDQAWRIATRRARGMQLMGARDFTGPHWLVELEPGDVVTAPDPALPYLSTRWWMVQRSVLMAKQDGLTTQISLVEIDSAIDAAPPAIGAAAGFTPSSLSRALAVPAVTIGQRVVSGGSGGQYPELTFLIPDTASQSSGVVQLQGPASANDNALLAAAQIRNINLSRGLLANTIVVPGWYRWRAAGRDVDGSVGAFDASWQAAVQVTAPLGSGQASSVLPGAVRVGIDVYPGSGSTPLPGTALLNEAVPVGSNQVINSDLNQDTRGFFHTAETDITGTGVTINSGRNLAVGPGYFGARNVFWTEVTGAALSLTGTFIRGWAQRGFFAGLSENQRWASRCKPGDRIYAAASVSVHGMTQARIIVRFFNNGGFIVSNDDFFSVTQTIGDARVSGPTGVQGLPANYARVGGFFTAPPNAVFCTMAVEGRNLNGPQTAVYIFHCEYQLAVVPAGQTTPPPYAPGPTDMAADRTVENTANGIVGQGSGATANNLSQLNPTEGSKLGGIALGATKNIVSSGTLAGRPVGEDGDFYFATDTQLLYQKIAGSWVISANNYTNTNQLADGAALGQTAIWSSVSGTGRPADNATVNRITSSTTAPVSPVNGDIWVDTNAPVTIKTRVAGAWVPSGNIPTTLSQVNPGEGSKLGGIEAGADVTAGKTAAAISGQGDLATTNRAQLPFGANQVVNSDFTRGTYAWASDAGAGNWGVNLSPAWSGQRNVFFASVPGTLAAGAYIDSSPAALWCGAGLGAANTLAMSAFENDRIVARALLARHRCRSQLWILAFNSAGGLTAAVSAEGGRPGGAASGDPANFDEVTVATTAPAGTRYAILMVRMIGDTGGSTNPYVFMTEPLLARVPAGQTTAPPYTPGRTDPIADRTSDNTAGGIVGQGNQATANSSSGTLASRPTGNNGDTFYATDTREVYFRSGGTWIKVADLANTFSVSLSTTNITVTGAPGTLTTGNVTATPSGGSGSYTYAWAVITKDVQSLNPFMTSQSATSSCRATLGSGQSVSGTIQLTVTDTGTGAIQIRTLSYSINTNS